MLRTDVLARLLLARLVALGPMTEPAAIDALDVRAPGRAEEIIAHAQQWGMIRRIPGTNGQPATLEALGSRSMVA
jgi:hypothetical protein